MKILADLNTHSEALSQLFDFPAASGPVGIDDKSQVLSPILTSSSLTGADPAQTWDTLNSFLPIFELLGPKLVLDQNAYYIHGLVDDNDLAVLRDHRLMVTEFILSDGDVENIKPKIAPSAFLHISRLLEPNSAFLPSLLRLRIIHTDSYFDCLHLLQTPSLKILEATDVPDHHHPTFFSFLTTLEHKAPFIEDITLGPGRFPLKSLQAILKFTHLHQLELRDAASTINFILFQDIGALPNLESFILDARSCEYISRIPEKQDQSLSPEHTDVGSQTPKSSSDIDSDGPSGDAYFRSSCLGTPILGIHEDDNKTVDHPLQPICEQISGDTNSSASMVGGFPQLKKFHVFGGLPLIQDMIPYIASSTLEDISITVIRLSVQELKDPLTPIQEMEEKAEREALAKVEQRRLARPFPSSVFNGGWREWKEAEAEDKKIEELKTAEATERMQKRKQATFDHHTALYITVLETVSFRWSAHLKVVRFNQLDQSSQPLSIAPTLPNQVYETLFYHPKIEILDFKRWKVDSMEDLLFSLKTSGPKNLKQLHLPIDGPCSAVSLSDLLDIAKACPMLESLQCCVSTLPPIPEYSVPTSKGLSHGLKALFVANDPTSPWDFDQLILVARHLYLLFPYLKALDIVEGSNAEQWVRVRNLVKVFQTIHKDDMYRFATV
ncbi:hypothetical protein BYT27DRAFT_7254564 [Phlegmacium glaucopus]|nr:hypothetical protein BYT27DRAFT_7254564 [Phlegmacium glaucopus]